MSLGVAIALLVGLAGTIVVSCYAIPTPDCGFICGPGGACPDGTTCADDHRCHRNGAPADLVCSTVDAPLPTDASAAEAAVDGAADAPDASIDAL